MSSSVFTHQSTMYLLIDCMDVYCRHARACIDAPKRRYNYYIHKHVLCRCAHWFLQCDFDCQLSCLQAIRLQLRCRMNICTFAVLYFMIHSNILGFITVFNANLMSCERTFLFWPIARRKEKRLNFFIEKRCRAAK